MCPVAKAHTYLIGRNQPRRRGQCGNGNVVLAGRRAPTLVRVGTMARRETAYVRPPGRRPPFGGTKQANKLFGPRGIHAKTNRSCRWGGDDRQRRGRGQFVVVL